jgi:hypothetical protein
LANENKKDVSFNFGEGNNKANGKIFSYSQVNVGGNGNLNQRPNGNLQNQINLAHNQAGLQPSHSSSPLPSQLQPQLKTQINFGGNTFVNGPSNYQNFPGLM